MNRNCEKNVFSMFHRLYVQACVIPVGFCVMIENDNVRVVYENGRSPLSRVLL